MTPSPNQGLISDDKLRSHLIDDPTNRPSLGEHQDSNNSDDHENDPGPPTSLTIMDLENGSGGGESSNAISTPISTPNKRDSMDGSASKRASFVSLTGNKRAVNRTKSIKSVSGLSSPDSDMGDAVETMTISTTKSSHLSMGENNVWSRFLLKKSSIWHDDISTILDDDEFEQLTSWQSLKLAFSDWVYASKSECFHCANTLRQNPLLLLWFSLCLAILVACSVTAVTAIEERQAHDAKTECTYLAKDTAQWFRDEFQKTLLPLYSLQQAVTHSPYFKELANQIGPRDGIFSAPTVPGPKNAYDYRDVAGICDDQELQTVFDQMVEDIQMENSMDGWVVQYRLAPHSVFCYASPLVNDKDFGPGQSFSGEKAIGWDVLNTPNPMWHKTSRKTLRQTAPEVDIFGPVDFAPQGISLMPEMWCAHVNVPMPGFEINVDGEIIESWGLIQNFLHWSKLKEESGIYERFDRVGMDFKLIRKDTFVNQTTGLEQIKEVIIAESNKSQALDDSNSVLISVETANGMWYNRVGYADGFHPSWALPVKLLCAAMSLVCAIIFLIILIQKKLHTKLLYKMMPKRAIRKLERGQTVVERYRMVTMFFSDIVGFTNMSGSLDPIQIMAMLNELYIEFDKLAAKHKIYKVETIGDAYMVVAGAPDRCAATEAAERIASFALDAVHFVENYRTLEGAQIYIRAGIHSGPVMAGVVGKAMPRYCFFGDTVNVSSRMESTSKRMQIQCSDMTHRLLQDAPTRNFELEERREGDSAGVHLKGKGLTHTWWIKSSCERTDVPTNITLGNYDTRGGESSSRNNKKYRSLLSRNSIRNQDDFQDLEGFDLKELPEEGAEVDAETAPLSSTSHQAPTLEALGALQLAPGTPETATNSTSFVSPSPPTNGGKGIICPTLEEQDVNNNNLGENV